MNLLSKVISKCRASGTSVSRHVIRTVSSNTVTSKKKTTGLELPFRIERGPTDILNALSKTVPFDITGAPYRFMDDPYLRPYTQSMQRMSLFSQQAGRDAARWVRDQHPELFGQVIADPPVERYLIAKPITDETPVNEEFLLKQMNEIRVSDALKVYELMLAQEIDLSRSSRQALLEFLCYFNCEDPIPEDKVAERYHGTGDWAPTEQANTWSYNPLLQSLFDSLKPDAAAYSAMICGLYRHGAKKEGDNLFMEAKQENIILDVQAYNSYISRVVTMFADPASKLNLCLDILKEMTEKAVDPDVGTLNAVMENLSKLVVRDKFKIAVKLLGSFHQRGIEPSLGTYALLLRGFSRDRRMAKQLLHMMVDGLKDKDIRIIHPLDTEFFSVMMDVSCQLGDVEYAISVFEMAHHSNSNHALIGDGLHNLKFYFNFLRLMVRSAPFEVTMKYYNQVVPNFYFPEASFFQAAAEACDQAAALEHLPTLWEDFMRSNALNQKTLVKILEVAVNLGEYDLPCAKEVIPKLGYLAKVLWTYLLEKKDVIYRNDFVCTPEVSNSLLVLLARVHDWSSVTNIMEKQKEDCLSPCISTLQTVLGCCIEDGHSDMALMVAKYGKENSLVDQLVQSSLMTSVQREELKQLMQNKNPEDTSSSSSSSDSESSDDSSDSDDSHSTVKKTPPKSDKSASK